VLFRSLTLARTSTTVIPRITAMAKLSRFVPFRARPQDVRDLKRWARAQGGDVSTVIRSMIKERRIWESSIVDASDDERAA